MRWLLVSDLHYALKQFDWVLNEAKAFDVVVIAGDHLDISSTVEVRAQIAVTLTYLRRLQAKTRLIVCSGNHDLDARNAAGERFASWISKVRKFGVPTDEDCLVVNGTLFTICPWWDGPQTCAKVGAQLARDAEKPKDRWIWVYHAPPDKSPTSWSGRKHFGDVHLAQWIEQYAPDIVLTGHIHRVAFPRGRLLGGSVGIHVGLQSRPTDRPVSHAHRFRYRRTEGALVLAGRCRGRAIGRTPQASSA